MDTVQLSLVPIVVSAEPPLCCSASHANINCVNNQLLTILYLSFATLEGADLTLYGTHSEETDLRDTVELVKSKADRKRKITSIALDPRSEGECKKLVQTHLDFHGGKLDTLILNHGAQNEVTDIAQLGSGQCRPLTQIFIHSSTSLKLLSRPWKRALIPPSLLTLLLTPPSATQSFLDYTATNLKGAIYGFMRALSNQIVGEKGIRCNVVTPGPIWIPLIPKTMTEDPVKTFGQTVPMKRAGQPVEVATCFVFLPPRTPATS
ncbi:hypothetical protein BDY19DRAFT_62399 [Irpex rosettiformis]|uniref:Uncharacterized protein n=1 Tax=Irpex rosettiformis TaxID=378272 RepID=A0ACB8UKZ3_9APHY|nr:hypothetical protein BDY19DRAFT_62399 [Irpex rosettiformis]